MYMTTSILLPLLIGLLLGALITALFLQSRRHHLLSRIDVLEARLKDQTTRAATLLTTKEQAHAEALHERDRAHEAAMQEKERHHEAILQSKEQAHEAAMQEKDRVHRETLQTQQAQFDETMAKVSAQMQVATDEMLKQRQREFAEASNANLGQIVNPLRETIDRMKQAMTESTEKQTAMSGEMKAHIENMMRQSAATQKSADELTRTFRHDNRAQGVWGEVILDELLEAQGLKRGIHYDIQSYIRDTQGNAVTAEHGSKLKPDVILHLDQRREVIIDSKVSLSAFMDYANATSDEERKRHLDAHISSIRNHVRTLSTKDYSTYVQPPKVCMDYVIMFVPHSAALWTALNARPDLWRTAMSQNVFIADGQTLFAALRIIHLTWTQIAQAQNHERVYALANEMLDRVGQFLKKYEAIGTALAKAQNAYDDGARKLAPTGQSILQTCGKLQKLGAKQSDKNPLPQLTDIDDIPALEEQIPNDTIPQEEA